jgi:hypothetical protein
LQLGIWGPAEAAITVVVEIVMTGPSNATAIRRFAGTSTTSS